MKIDWKNVVPIVILITIMLVYFMKVKPIEGFENVNLNKNENKNKNNIKMKNLRSILY